MHTIPFLLASGFLLDCLLRLVPLVVVMWVLGVCCCSSIALFSWLRIRSGKV